MLLNNEELKNIRGGGFSIALSLALAGLITFAIGIIDGYVRPIKCNK